jgi:outer membrane protein TolC
VCAQSQIDSLELSQLALGIQKAEDQVSRTGLLYRLIPEVHVSASYGIGDLLFIDPSSTSTYILPKDSYRLSFSLSLSELFFSSKHSEALLQLSIQQTEYHHKIFLQQKNRSILLQELSLLDERIHSLKTEISMIQDLFQFNQLRFNQGKIEYDVLIRTKLELLSLETNMNALKHQRAEQILKLQ